MSSLLQFGGEVSRAGVNLEAYQVSPSKRWPDSETLGDPVELVPCTVCGNAHPGLHVFVRKPVGVLGCRVVFRWHGTEHVPDLSCPFGLFKLPRGSKACTDAESSERWHRN